MELSSELSQAVERMPAFPSSIQQIIRITSDINVEAREVVQIIRHDPVLTIKLLSLVNSAYFGLPNRVTSIHQAYMLLGLNTTRNLLLSISAIRAIPNIDHVPFLKRTEFLLHSLSTALLARIIAKRNQFPKSNLEDYFIAGLLHDFGRIVMVNANPEKYTQVVQHTKESGNYILQSEQEFYGFFHTEVGFELARHWNLSSFIQQALLMHHDPNASEQPEDDIPHKLIETVYCANILASRANQGFSGDVGPAYIDESSFRDLNIDDESEPEFLCELKEELDKAKIILQL